MSKSKEIIFLIGEDDDDDFFLIEKALKTDIYENVQIVRARDGKSLMSILLQCVEQEGRSKAIVVLLDLNMPKTDGRQVLQEIKSHETLKKIPTIILTTSQAREDIEKSYSLGSNAYFVKPSNFAEIEEMLHTIGRYWLRLAELPLA